MQIFEFLILVAQMRGYPPSSQSTSFGHLVKRLIGPPKVCSSNGGTQGLPSPGGCYLKA